MRISYVLLQFHYSQSLLTVALLLSSGLALKCNRDLEKQYPSPMVENSRVHQRIPREQLPGQRLIIEDMLPRPVSIYLPPIPDETTEIALLIHFHGAQYVVEYAVSNLHKPIAVAIVNLGSSSLAYEMPMQTSDKFDQLLFVIKQKLQALNLKGDINRVFLSAFSAGYGAVRAILQKDEGDKIDRILLLDGLHTDYIPARTPLSWGGKLNVTKLEPFLKYAQAALQGKKKFLITHSEIFPGTYASTTETCDYLIQSLGLVRKPVLKWGPVGMQQTSEVGCNGLWILGFAGNSAPDHLDHLHGLTEFLSYLTQL